MTVSSSNPSCLKICGVESSVGTISGENAVIHFAAGQTGPYSVTFNPLDGYNYASNIITVTATADKTCSSASHSIWVKNVAPSVEVSPLDENSEWVVLF
ncbi:MAG: hypothetical protein IJP66_03865 [Kiritimatiellae bacterium]|nr:hypothetical protein [Kiritimatiellia bacterium]